MTIDGHAVSGSDLVKMAYRGVITKNEFDAIMKSEQPQIYTVADDAQMLRDENARLRSALQRIADGDFPHEEGCWQVVDCSCGSNIARQALEAKQ